MERHDSHRTMNPSPKPTKSKPISSPSRSDHFPAPLMGFLRTDTAGRSRTGRSRSSPIFVRKKTAAIETQEPSSPKVTCMGQVRTRRSSKTAAPAKCRFIRTSCRFFWEKWVLFFRRKPKNFESRAGDERENSENGERENKAVFASSVSTLPENALILTRCKTAPHRSLSYGEVKRVSGNSGLFKKLGERTDSNSESCRESKVREEEVNSGGSSRPLILTRCKSEPARIAEKLFPEIQFPGKVKPG